MDKYNPNARYNVGDEVEFNGKQWRARLPVYHQPQLQPRVDSTHWEDITPAAAPKAEPEKK